MPRQLILLVDNDQDVRDVILKMLKKLGFKVVSVANGCDALSALKETFFDAVISEYNLADMTGLMLAKSLKQIRPDMPILLLTAFVDPTVQQLIEAEGFSFKTKPVLRHELRDALRDLLRRE